MVLNEILDTMEKQKLKFTNRVILNSVIISDIGLSIPTVEKVWGIVKTYSVPCNKETLVILLRALGKKKEQKEIVEEVLVAILKAEKDSVRSNPFDEPRSLSRTGPNNEELFEDEEGDEFGQVEEELEEEEDDEEEEEEEEEEEKEKRKGKKQRRNEKLKRNRVDPEESFEFSRHDSRFP